MSFLSALRAVWAVISSALWHLLALPLDVLGLVLVSVMVFMGYDGYSTPSWGWLWGNAQESWDGLDNPRWRAKREGWPVWLTRIEYGAIRNRTSNLRFLGLVVPSGLMDSDYGVFPWKGGWWRITWDTEKWWLCLIELFWKPNWFSKFGARMGPVWTKDGTNFAWRMLGRY